MNLTVTCADLASMSTEGGPGRSGGTGTTRRWSCVAVAPCDGRTTIAHITDPPRNLPPPPAWHALRRSATTVVKINYGVRLRVTGSTHGLSATYAFYGIIPPPSVLREPCRRACGDRWTRCSTSPVHGLSVAVRGLTGEATARAHKVDFPRSRALGLAHTPNLGGWAPETG